MPMDSLGNFMGVSAAQAAAVSRSITTMGPTSMKSQASQQSTFASRAASGATAASGQWGSSQKTLADYVKESAWQGSSQNQQQQTSSAGSMPWAAAVKAPADNQGLHHGLGSSSSTASAMTSNLDNYNNIIGSWGVSSDVMSSSSGTSGAGGSGVIRASSSGSGWGLSAMSSVGDMQPLTKSDSNVPDDGTAIWGNPIAKKTGVDWVDKEANSQSQHRKANADRPQRVQKTENVISSINGTEAWGAPISSQAKISNNGNNGNTNNYGSKASSDSTGWGEATASSLQQTAASSSSAVAATIASRNNNSSPPSQSNAWNSVDFGNKKSSVDWLATTGDSRTITSSNANSKLDELSKQLSSTSLFDSIAGRQQDPTTKTKILEQSPASAAEASMRSFLGGLSGDVLTNGCLTNDLKQMSANYQNDALDAADRQNSSSSSISAAATVGLLSSLGDNRSQQGPDSSVYSSVAAPSRDLLKQMVHQIQLAVQAGHLSAHILNQPMSTPTLQLVYQLLQQIKTLQILQEYQQRAASSKSSDIITQSSLELQTNRVRQNIGLIQKAIAQQQQLHANHNKSADNDQASNKHSSNQSYANISKLSTTMKVPHQQQADSMSGILNGTTMDSFKRTSLLETLQNNPEQLSQIAAAMGGLDKVIQQQQNDTANQLLMAANKLGLGQQQRQSPPQNLNKSVGAIGASLSSAGQQISSGWSAFGSGNILTQSLSSSQRGQSSGASSSSDSWPDQLRFSSTNASQRDQKDQTFSAFDSVPDYGSASGKMWRDESDTKSAAAQHLAAINSMNRISSNTNNVGGANDHSSVLKQQQDNRDEFLNRDSSSSSLFGGWSSNSNSVESTMQSKRNYDGLVSNSALAALVSGNSANLGASSSSYSSSAAVGGLSLQTNPWLFSPPTSTASAAINLGTNNSNNDHMSTSTNNSNQSHKNGIGASLFDNTADNDRNGASAAPGSDSLFQLKSGSGGNASASSAVYDWGDLTSVSASSSSASSASRRPAPPPGLLNNFGSIIRSSAGSAAAASATSSNGISLMDTKLANSSLNNNATNNGITSQGSVGHTSQQQQSSGASNLWSGNWFD